MQGPIAILTSDEDEHADHVASVLTERGTPFIRFDPALFPRAAGISLSYATDGVERYVLSTEGRRIDLSSIRAVWYRRPGLPAAHDVIVDFKMRKFIEQECRALTSDLWRSLSCPWLPGKPAVVQHAGHKGLQLKLAGELGFEIPPTLITNNPSDLLEFYREHDGNIVSKLVSGAFSETYGKDYARYTEMVGRRDVARMHDLVYCPMIFQAYVAKRVELRITVVGDQIFAAEIHSQSSNHTKLDWRHYDEYQTPYLVHELPAEVARHCISLVRALGLCYGAIDMIVTEDERYVFLEINPNGQYLWIENLTGLPITSAICDELELGPLSVERRAGDRLDLEARA